MKKLLILALAIFSFTQVNAQEGVTVSGNTVTMREVAPVWPGCESGQSERAMKKCFDQNLINHIITSYPKVVKTRINGTHVVTVKFQINEEGYVEMGDVTGGDATLQEYAREIIQTIPQLTPGHLGGTPRSISYTVPIKFKG